MENPEVQNPEFYFYFFTGCVKVIGILKISDIIFFIFIREHSILIYNLSSVQLYTVLNKMYKYHSSKTYVHTAPAFTSLQFTQNLIFIK